MKLLRALANAWLLLFWADAAVGVVDELLALVLDLHVFGMARAVTSVLVVLGVPALWLGMAATRALPLRVFVPATLFVVWILLGASPVTILLLGSDYLRLVLAGTELAVACFVGWQASRIVVPGSRWVVEVPVAERVRGGRLALWTAAHLVLAPPLLGAYAWTSADLTLRRSTGGFVGLAVDGVRVVHRAYARGDRTVDLVGMIHVGDPLAYEALFEGIPVEGTVVLEEGVRDSEGLLPAGPVYERLATGLGVTMQRPIGELSRLETRNADVDVSDFSEETLKFLRKVLAIYSSDDPAAAVLDYVMYVQRQPDPEALVDLVLADVVVMRNAHLLHEVDRALEDHSRVVVPWGAYHLPEIEESLLGDGFQVVDQRSVTLIPFAAVFGAP